MVVLLNNSDVIIAANMPFYSEFNSISSSEQSRRRMSRPGSSPWLPWRMPHAGLSWPLPFGQVWSHQRSSNFSQRGASEYLIRNPVAPHRKIRQVLPAIVVSGSLVEPAPPVSLVDVAMIGDALFSGTALADVTENGRVPWSSGEMKAASGGGFAAAGVDVCSTFIFFSSGCTDNRALLRVPITRFRGSSLRGLGALWNEEMKDACSASVSSKSNGDLKIKSRVQSINRTINQSIKQASNQSINQSIKQWNDYSIKPAGRFKR